MIFVLVGILIVLAAYGIIQVLGALADILEELETHTEIMVMAREVEQAAILKLADAAMRTV